MKKIILFTVILFFGLEAGVIGNILVGNLKRNVSEQTPAQTSSPTPEIKLVQPSDSIGAKLVKVNGGVKIIPWDSFEKNDANNGQKLYQGDELIGEDNSNFSVTLGNYTGIDVSAGGDIELSSLVDGRVLAHQKKGTALYATSDQNKTLNVVAGGGLLETSNSQFEITYNGGLAEISIIKGEAKFAYANDSENVRVWQLGVGDKVKVNNTRGTVVTSGKQLLS